MNKNINKKLQAADIFPCLLGAFILLLSLLGTIKVIFLGVDVDEHYAVAMPWRMVCGDRMFLEMWEPHQTSCFLAAFFIKIYMTVTGGVEYLVLFLRVIGTLFHAAVSVLVYRTMRKFSSFNTAFIAAAFFYNTLPKFSPVPEFANMLIWFSTLMFLCLIRFFLEENNRIIWLIMAGLCMSLMVLSYPTSILAVIPATIGILCVSRKEKRLFHAAVYMGTCAFCGTAYLAYFLSHMSVKDFLYGLEQMYMDGTHRVGTAVKLSSYGEDLARLAPHILITVGLALCVWVFMTLVLKTGKYRFLLCLLAVSCLEQSFMWIFEKNYLRFPLIFYVALVLIGVIRYWRREAYGLPGGQALHRTIFWFGSMTGLCLLFSAFMASDLHLYESNEYMMVGFLASIWYLEYEHRENRRWWTAAVLILLGVVLFRKGFFMYQPYGKDTVFVAKQKAVSGPLAGVYCRWSDGTEYNASRELVLQHVPDGSAVMYVGEKTLMYLFGEYRVSNHSTICTPTIDERLLAYWEQYPEKYPEYIIWDSEISALYMPGDEITEQMLADTELLADEDGLQIYRKNRIE